MIAKNRALLMEVMRLARMMPARRHMFAAGQGGFTLVEILAGLAIASVIIVASAALTRDVALFFDRGTHDVGEAERLMLAVDRLAGDFGSVRYVYPSLAQPPGAADRPGRVEGPGPIDPRAAAAAKRPVLFAAEPGKVVFVAAGGIPARARGEEVVTLTIEDADGVARLVRRRAAWPGPRTRIEDLTPDDPVVLIEGRVDIAFTFARIAQDGSLSWSPDWSDSVLPRFVRLTVRDRATGTDLLSAAEFVVRADAPMACGDAQASAGCLSAPPAADNNPNAKLRGPQTTEGPKDVL